MRNGINAELRKVFAPERMALECLRSLASGHVDTNGIIEIVFVDHLFYRFQLTAWRVNSNNCQSVCRAVFVKSTQLGQSAAARAAPVGPKVQNDHFASECLPGERLAIEPS